MNLHFPLVADWEIRTNSHSYSESDIQQEVTITSTPQHRVMFLDVYVSAIDSVRTD